MKNITALLTKTHHRWLLPTLLCCLLGLIILLQNGWTFNIYDELSWLKMIYEKMSLADFIRGDFEKLGRFRPLSFFINQIKYTITTDPQILRIERYAEWLLFLSLAYALFSKLIEQPLIRVLVVVFLIKSPPILELIHVYTVSELPFLLFLTAATLLWWQGRRVLSAIAVLIACLFKEPSLIFLSFIFLLVDWISDTSTKKYIFNKRYIASLLFSLVVLVFLYLNRRGGYYELRSNSYLIREILSKSILDFAPLILIILTTGRRAPKLFANFANQSIDRRKFVVGILSIAYGLAYAGVIFSTSSGWTFHFSPAVFFITLGLLLLLDLLKPATIVLLPFLIILPLRLPYNLYREWQRHIPRKERIEVIKKAPTGIPFVSNCLIDAVGLGFAADRRPERLECFGRKMVECCQQEPLIVELDINCPDYSYIEGEFEKHNFPGYDGGKTGFIIECFPNDSSDWGELED